MEFNSDKIVEKFMSILSRMYPEKQEDLKKHIGLDGDMRKTVEGLMHYGRKDFSVTDGGDIRIMDAYQKLLKGEMDLHDCFDVYISSELMKMAADALKIREDAYYRAIVVDVAYNIRDMLSSYKDGNYTVPRYEEYLKESDEIEIE